MHLSVQQASVSCQPGPTGCSAMLTLINQLHLTNNPSHTVYCKSN